MRTRITAAAVAAAAIVGLALVPAAPAAGHDPRPLAPDAAAALVDGVPAVAGGSATRAVGAREALAAASRPGASVWVAPGFSLEQAVGLAAEGGGGATQAAAVAAAVAVGTPYCWANAAWHEWGTWPYQQRITDTTYWCALYGTAITYRSSKATGSGTLCATSWTSSQLIAGGIGYSWFTTRSSAGFSCPTVIPWISLHPSHYEDVARNDWGSTSEVRSG